MILYNGSINSNFKSVDEIVTSIIEDARKNEFLSDEGFLFKINFVLRELLNNSVEHGNKFNEFKFIKCKISFDNPEFCIEIMDEGVGISFDKISDWLISYDKRERHRGIKLIKELGFDVKIDLNKIIAKISI